MLIYDYDDYDYDYESMTMSNREWTVVQVKSTNHIYRHNTVFIGSKLLSTGCSTLCYTENNCWIMTTMKEWVNITWYMPESPASSIDMCTTAG